MLAALNRQLFEATVFDSGALGLMTSVAHRFTTAGLYAVTAKKVGARMGSATFEVREDATAMQLDIDLAMTQGPRGNGCSSRTFDRAPQIVSPRGYVIFHSSSGSGWSADTGTGMESVFDSTRLTKGDIFALTLLEPALYKIENRLGSAKGSIEVCFTRADVTRLGELQPVLVTVGKTLEPDHFTLISTQGLIFRIETDARIVITRQEKQASSVRV